MSTDIDKLQYVTGALPDSSIKWHKVIEALISTFRADMDALKMYQSISTSKGEWLSNIGLFLEYNRGVVQTYLQDDTDEIKLKKDNLYRLVVLLKATSIYDDYNYNVFNELAKTFGLDNKLLVNIFDGFIQYSFIDLNPSEKTKALEKYSVLKDFKVGRVGFRVTIGEQDTFKLDGQFGKKFSKLEYEKL